MKVYLHLITLEMIQNFKARAWNQYIADSWSIVSWFRKPFKLNDDGNHIVEYQGELDPDKNYFNQFVYHLRQSSKYHREDSFNKNRSLQC